MTLSHTTLMLDVEEERYNYVGNIPTEKLQRLAHHELLNSPTLSLELPSSHREALLIIFLSPLPR